MATALLARTVRAVINGHRGLDRRANVLHFQVTDTNVTNADVDAICQAVVNFVTSDYKNCFSSAVILDDVTATDASRPDGYQKVLPLTAMAGTQSSEAVPGNACPVVTLHTGQPGRSGRGRVYTFEPATQWLQATDDWSPTLQTSIQAAFQNLLDATIAEGTYRLAVGSRKGLCSFDVTSVVAHTYIASQKDRLPGHRRHKKPAA